MRITITLRYCLLVLATGALLVLHPHLAKSNHTKQQQLPEEEKITLVQAIRRILGLSRRVAVGGGRSRIAAWICLISPELEELDGQLQARVNVSSPIILTAEPLNELSIIKDGRIIYQKLATSTEAIETPFPWPLPPLRGGERLTMKLRPRGAAGGDSARVPLLVASADALQQNDYILNRLTRQSRLSDINGGVNEKTPTNLLTQIISTSLHNNQITQAKNGLMSSVKKACEIQK